MIIFCHFSSREANRADQPEIQSFLFDKHPEQTCQTFRRAGCFADPGGVFPMVIATGAGAGSRQAIGITTFSGMLQATLVGIVFTPALYAAFQRIAEEALKHISENDILFLDSSTTVYHLAKLLENTGFSSLTIVTNSIMIIQDFHKFPSHYVRIGLGGSYDMQLNSFLGQSTLRELEYLEISKAFVSAFGADEDKVTTNHEYHASLLMKVMEIARKKYLLIDKSKLDRNGLFKVSSVRAFDGILTD